MIIERTLKASLLITNRPTCRTVVADQALNALIFMTYRRGVTAVRRIGTRLANTVDAGRAIDGTVSVLGALRNLLR